MSDVYKSQSARDVEYTHQLCFLNDRRTDLSSQKLSHNSSHPIPPTSEPSAQQLMASYCLSEHKNDCQVFVSIFIVSLNIPRCFAALDFSVELSFLSLLRE